MSSPKPQFEAVSTFIRAPLVSIYGINALYPSHFTDASSPLFPPLPTPPNP